MRKAGAICKCIANALAVTRFGAEESAIWAMLIRCVQSLSEPAAPLTCSARLGSARGSTAVTNGRAHSTQIACTWGIATRRDASIVANWIRIVGYCV